MTTPFLDELADLCANKWHQTKILDVMERKAFKRHLERTWKEKLRPLAIQEAGKGYTTWFGCFSIAEYKFQAFVPMRQDVIDNLPDELAQAWAVGALRVEYGTPSQYEIHLNCRKQAEKRHNDLRSKYGWPDAEATPAAKRAKAEAEVKTEAP